MSGDHGRVRPVNECEFRTDGRYVLYWMQQSQRALNNPALERAAAWANKLDKPLFVLFALTADYPDANARHYTFMLEGLAEVGKALAKRNAHFAVREGDPAEVCARVARDACVLVADRGYLRHQVAWRTDLADAVGCLMEVVEGDVVVPVEAASPKLEYAARTIRKKLHQGADTFAELPSTVPLSVAAKNLESNEDLALDDAASVVERLGCDTSVGPVAAWKGGTRAARARLKAFLSDGLPRYGDGRADIVNRNMSELSPYLHFGQISPVEVYLAAKDASAGTESKASYIDELMVRRELAVNFVHYNKDYDVYAGLPEWARKTLADHSDDDRGETFTAAQMEAGETDDPYWNAAMREMRLTGYLHNHLRMYWGKRIIAYTKTPEHAYRTALRLNNKYFIDGRDANSFANVGWLFGVHDRGWPERAVFGKVRTMMPSGLKRKFDIDAYVKWANALPE